MPNKTEPPVITLGLKLKIFAVAYQFLYTPNRFEQTRILSTIESALIKHQEVKNSADALYKSLKLEVKALTGRGASPFEITDDTLKVPVAFKRQFNETQPFLDKYGMATIQVRDDYFLLDIRDDIFPDEAPIFRAEIKGKQTRHSDVSNKENFDFDEEGYTAFFALNVFNFAQELVRQVVPNAFEAPRVSDEDDPDLNDFSGESNWIESGVLGIWLRARELAIHHLDDQQDQQLTDLLLKKFLAEESYVV